VHRQGSGRGAARAVAAAARQRTRCFPGGRDDIAAGEEDTFTIDRTPRCSLATAGTGGGLLLSFELELKVTTITGARGLSVRPPEYARVWKCIIHGCTLSICTGSKSFSNKSAHRACHCFSTRNNERTNENTMMIYVTFTFFNDH